MTCSATSMALFREHGHYVGTAKSGRALEGTLEGDMRGKARLIAGCQREGQKWIKPRHNQIRGVGISTEDGRAGITEAIFQCVTRGKQACTNAFCAGAERGADVDVAGANAWLAPSAFKVLL